MHCQYCAINTAGKHMDYCPYSSNNRPVPVDVNPDPPVVVNYIYVVTTGHRKFGDFPYMEFQAERFVIDMKDSGVSGVYIGGAIGWDTLVAKYCYLHGVRYHLKFAYTYQAKEMQRTLLGQAIYDGAGSTYIHKEDYNDNGASFQPRNIKMVDMANEVHAFYSGLKGGTRNTIEYARKQGKPVTNWC